MSIIIKKELWRQPNKTKRRAILTARKNGKILSYTTIKGKDIKQLKRQFKSSNSFNPNIASVERLDTGTKTTVYKKEPRKNQKLTQLQVTVAIANIQTGKTKTFTGFTKRGQISTTQAELNAIRVAQGKGFIAYDDSQGFDFVTKIKRVEYRQVKKRNGNT